MCKTTHDLYIYITVCIYLFMCVYCVCVRGRATRFACCAYKVFPRSNFAETSLNPHARVRRSRYIYNNISSLDQLVGVRTGRWVVRKSDRWEGCFFATVIV
jgi:hypothetical protein